jgi:glutamine---fructose-6-phosphate transaminase (isomerizing)
MSMTAPPAPVPERTSHPFLTYDMIKDIPKGFRATVQKLSGFQPEMADGGSLVFTGNGTAYYSAAMGSQVLNLSGRDWREVQAFELAHYKQSFGRKTAITVGVSHSGITKSTLEALTTAKSLGSKTIGVTHFADRPISGVADETLVVGDSPDRSRCHTKAYTNSAAAVFSLSLALASPLDAELQNLGENFRKGLADEIEATISRTEQAAKKAAADLRNVSKIYFAGAGPNLVTAREAALKNKEASYLPAEGMELEEIQHGPAMSFNSETLVVVLAPSGPSVERARDLLAASRKIGATTMVVSDVADLDADYKFPIKQTPEYLSPFLAIIPPYLFSYFLAVEKGRNPDYIHYTDPTYWQARTIIFPPGTH